MKRKKVQMPIIEEQRQARIKTSEKSILSTLVCNLWLFAFAICLIGLGGCAQWRDQSRGPGGEAASDQLLQQSTMSADSVVLEISIISLPPNRTDEIDKLFKTLDMTRVELDQRKSWDRNGLRVGVSGNAMPMEFDELLESEIQDEDSGQTDETKLAPRRRIQARSGKPFRIATRPIESELSWFTIMADGYRTGGSRTNAQTEFEVRSYAKGDGSIQIRLSPEILFGEPKRVVTTSNASLRYEMKRDAITFPDLDLEANLYLGESLLLAAQTGGNSESTATLPFGLGQAFFKGDDGETKLVMIRLAQSQKDDLFDSSQNSQPLESLTE